MGRERVGVDLFEGGGDPTVESLETAVRDLVEQRLADHLVLEREPDRRGLDRRDDQADPFGLVDRVEQLVLGDVSQCLEQFEAEVTPEQAGEAEQLASRRFELLEAALDHEPNTFGHRQIGQSEVGVPSRVGDGSALDELADELAGEERVAFGSFVDRVDERERRFAGSGRTEQVGNVDPGQ